MSQTNYNLAFPESFPGQLVDSRQPAEVVTAIAGEDLEFGRAVYVSSWAGKNPVVMHVNASNLNPWGFVLFEHREGGTVKNKQDVAVIQKGAIWVDNTVSAVTGGSVAIVDSTSASAGQLQSSAAQSGDIQLTGCQFLSSGATGALVKLHINFPSYQITTA